MSGQDERPAIAVAHVVLHTPHLAESFTFMRTLGGSFAASLTTYAWTERGAVHHAHLTESIAATDPTTLATVSLASAWS